MSGLDKDTKLLIHGDGVDGAFEIHDSGSTGHIITQVGDAKLSTTYKKFGVTSCYFDGTVDDLQVPDHADWNFGAGDFTIDFWVNFSTVASSNGFLGATTGANQEQGFYFYWDTNGKTYFRWRATEGTRVGYYMTFNPSINTWHHIAVVRNGSNFYMFVDGISQSLTVENAISTLTLKDTDGDLSIGSEVVWHFLTGYMDEVRISDVARWVTDFTPPVIPYTSDANTKLLLHMNTRDVSFSSHILNFLGTAQIDTAQKKWGVSSLLFPGTDGNNINIASSSDWDFIGSNTGSYTIDFWTRLTPETGAAFFSQFLNSNERWYMVQDYGAGLRLVFLSGGTDIFYTNYSGTGATQQIDDNDWHHIAVVIIGDTSTKVAGVYLDGIQVCYVQDDSTATYDTNLLIGTYPGRGTTGNIDEFRVTKSNPFGAAPNDAFTDTITVPTEAYFNVKDYTRGGYEDLPTDDTQLENLFVLQDYTDVESENSVRVSQTALGKYSIFLFKDNNDAIEEIIVEWNGQSSIAPSNQIIYLQIFDRVTGGGTWETIDSNDAALANTDFTLSGSIIDSGLVLSNYYDENKWIACRVYQDK